MPEEPNTPDTMPLPDSFEAALAAKPIGLRDWSVRPVRRDPYKEATEAALHGELVGHPDHPDGTFVALGTVLEVRGRLVTTRRGTYRLGRVERKYRAWIDAQGLIYDRSTPFQLVIEPCPVIRVPAPGDGDGDGEHDPLAEIKQYAAENGLIFQPIGGDDDDDDGDALAQAAARALALVDERLVDDFDD